MVVPALIFWGCLIGLAYTYVGYFFLIRFLAKRKSYQILSPESFELSASEIAKGTFPADYELPYVSLIIPAYNEENFIRDKMENCNWLSYRKDHIEVLVASDGSDDGTNSIVNKYANGYIKLLEFPRRRGKTAVLNDAIEKATGEIIILSDASSLLSMDAIENLTRHFYNEKVGCVSGSYKLIDIDVSSRSAGEGAYWKYETAIKKSESRMNSILGAHGAIYAFRKKLFKPLPTGAINDDYILPMKILEQGYKVVYETEAIGIELAKTNLGNEMKRRVRIAVGNFQQLFLLKNMLNPFKGMVSLQFFSHKFLRLAAPFLQIFLFLANTFLLEKGLIYQLAFVVQSLFYLASLIGWLLEYAKKKIKLFFFPFYFNFGNFTILVGFYKFITRKQSVLWDRADIN